MHQNVCFLPVLPSNCNHITPFYICCRLASYWVVPWQQAWHKAPCTFQAHHTPSFTWPWNKSFLSDHNPVRPCLMVRLSVQAAVVWAHQLLQAHAVLIHHQCTWPHLALRPPRPGGPRWCRYIFYGGWWVLAHLIYDWLFKFFIHFMVI